MLNVNIPAGNNLRGIRVTRLGVRRYENVLHKRRDPRGRIYYWLAGDVADMDADDKRTDTGAVRAGYVSVTPIQFDLTDHAALDDVQNWKLQLTTEVEGKN